MKARIILEVEPEIKKNLKRRVVELGTNITDHLTKLISEDLSKAKPVTIFAEKNNIRIKNA